MRPARPAAWGKLLGHMAFVSRLQNRFHHCGVVNLLCFIDLIARDATGVVMRNILVGALDGGDHVPFHNLHVIDIVKQFESLRADPFA